MQNLFPHNPATGTDWIDAYGNSWQYNGTSWVQRSAAATDAGGEAGSVAVQTTTGLLSNYTTLALAKTAAISGEVVSVGPGAYNAGNLGKPGVNMDFAPGANVTYAGEAYGIFDDGAAGAAADLVLSVTGSGKFQMTGAAGFEHSLINVTRAGTTLTITADTLSTTDITDSAPFPIFQNAGKIVGTFNRLEASNSPTYWEGGDAWITAKEIIQTGAEEAFGRAAVYGAPSAASAWYVTAQLVSAYSSGMSWAGTHVSGRLWLDAQKIIGTNAGAVWLSGSNGVVYITCQKVETSLTGASSRGCVQVDGATLHLTTQKVEGFSTTQNASIGVTGGLAYIKVLDELVDTGMTGIDCVNVNNGGELNLSVTKLIRTTNWHCVRLTAGTTRITNSLLSTGGFAGKSAIRGTSGAVLILRDVHLQVHAAADSIASIDGSTFTVICLGGCTSNRAVGANVTVVGTLTVNASFTA